ncbi:hypothetical protein CISG_05419 [Coccidioides immitis RMSCC 3703]|uniref:Uncharacterized protein n=2 Tax=Coccidioides immitis TaxID=5501 RepID=A0A0J8QX38_COCIT|nr:hypothetical protein CIRG_00687 [Coccidioides immitis RMSCC 2394]KMU75933.1 hypothetical protein CISG_05419 [Coccidioides immitis RMSCC 3703]
MLYMRRVDIQLMHEVHLASRDAADGGGRQGAARTTRTMQRRRATRTHTHRERERQRDEDAEREERAKADGEERKAKKEEKKAARAESVSQYADNTAQRRRGDLIRGGKQAAGGAWRPGGARWAGVGQSQPAAWAGDAGRDESFHAGCGPVIRLRYSCVLTRPAAAAACCPALSARCP